MRPFRERAGSFVLLIAVAFAALVVGRAASESRAELRTAQSHHAAGELARATEHYRRTLRWSFPFSPHTEEAVTGLQSIAKELEAEGDRDAALLAWRSLAGGLAASRFLYSRSSAARERAKREIARLLVLDGGAAIDTNLSPDKLEADHRRLLDRQPSPDPLWGAFLLLGFSAWVGSVVLLIQRGFDSSGRPVWPAARGPLWGALLGLASFVLGLLFA